ncbi:MAG: SpoIIE family protein phosphatase [Silvibacterium sp.]
MKKIGLVLLVFLPVSSLAFSQAATPPAVTPSVQLTTQAIDLGNSAVTLPGPWKFAPGDSPMVNGSLLWAQPGFDDANWAPMHVAAKAGSIDPAYGTPGFVPGWTKQGFPDLYGYAWYRLRLHVNDGGQPLWLKMPNDVDDAYQVYANGHYVGEFGEFTLRGVTAYSARTFSFQLPPPGPDGDILLALRFYMNSSTSFQSTDAGGMHGPPTLGLASTVRLLQAAEDDANLHFYLGTLLQAILFLLVAPLSLWAWFKNRRDRTYLWLFFALTYPIVSITNMAFSDLSSVIPLGPGYVWIGCFLEPLILPVWAMFWWHWFGLQEKRWIPRAAWLLTGARVLSLLGLRLPVDGIDLLPHAWLHWFNAASAVFLAALGVLLLVILIEGFRRDRTAALVAAVPILLIELASFAPYLLGSFGISTQFYPFGIGISTAAIASILMLVVIGVLVMRRFLRSQVKQELARQTIAQDLEQAQQLQQRVLVPETLHSTFFSVETAYHPAQTVGGDFFQTLAKPDGSLLVVIGDVSGKGVSAAMLVAVLVGTIRTRADESFEPASMLATLNHRLVGRSGGHFATCLAAELSPDGTMRLANAGHLPPYLNGKEMELEGSLPLGVSGEEGYSVQTFTLQPGDRLTFMTDGVVEATNPAHELFGFDRTREISGQSAAAIAGQAQRFGQEDDITVLGVEFATV